MANLLILFKCQFIQIKTWFIFLRIAGHLRLGFWLKTISISKCNFAANSHSGLILSYFSTVLFNCFYCKLLVALLIMLNISLIFGLFLKVIKDVFRCFCNISSTVVL